MLVKPKRNEMLTEILGLEELEVQDRRAVGANVYFHVQSKNEVAICPVCGAYVEDIKEYKEYTIRDLPARRETQKDIPKDKKEELKGSRWIISKNEEDLKPEEQAKLKKNL